MLVIHWEMHVIMKSFRSILLILGGMFGRFKERFIVYQVGVEKNSRHMVPNDSLEESFIFDPTDARKETSTEQAVQVNF